MLSKNLQKKETCLRDAQQHIQDIIAALEDDRRNSEKHFQLSYLKDTVACLKLEINPPRVCKRSTYRENQSMQSAFDYFWVAVFIPFFDFVLSQLHIRFNEMKFAGIFDVLLPSYCQKNGASEDDFRGLWATCSEALIANVIESTDTYGVKAAAQYRQ